MNRRHVLTDTQLPVLLIPQAENIFVFTENGYLSSPISLSL